MHLKKKIPHKNTGIAVDFFTSQVNKLSWPMRVCAIFLHSLSATVAQKNAKIKIIILLTIFSTFVRDFFDNFFPLLIAAQIDKKKTWRTRWKYWAEQKKMKRQKQETKTIEIERRKKQKESRARDQSQKAIYAKEGKRRRGRGRQGSRAMGD